uniref:Uncharacterized protein n=1 Tax=Psilocybe cubensis TaxID=181762 RepID=A0A8H7Y643_PSICU
MASSTMLKLLNTNSRVGGLPSNTNNFNVLHTAFDLLNSLPPPPGLDHYTESSNPTADNPDPDWIHEDTGISASTAGFNTWVARSPDGCVQSTTYQDSGAQMTCTAHIDIPAGVYPSSAEWTLEVDAQNAPVGSSWALTAYGPSVPGISIGFSRTTITDQESEECHFTGIPSSGYSFSVVLQWFSEGKAPGTDMSFSIVLSTTSPPEGTVNTNNNKVHLGRRRYKEIGSNQWPHAEMDKDDNLKSIPPDIVYSVGGDHWNFKFS